MSDDLAAQAAKQYWHHSIDLGGGVVTKGNKSLDVLNGEADLIFDRIDMRGRSVLDIGAWNGFFSFEADRRGAARVLATDSYCWNNEEFRGREAFDLAHAALKSTVEVKEIDVTDLSIQTVGQFDIVLYLGVFYHRYDTIEALSRVAALARDVLVVETYIDLRDLKVPAMRFYPGKELNGDPTNWWGPNEQLMELLLGGLGFAEVETSIHPTTDTRAIFHAWRSTAARLRPLPDELRLPAWSPPPAPSKPGLVGKLVREICRPFRQ